MKAIQLTAIIFCLYSSALAQSDRVIPKRFSNYMGLKIGANQITSYTLDEPNTTLQIGVTSDVYVAKNFSVMGAVKVYKTGLSFYNKAQSSNWITSAREESYGTFHSTVISMPIVAKFEFTLIKNLRFFIKAGPGLAYELAPIYDFSKNQQGNYTRLYSYGNFGVGITCFLNQSTAFFIEAEALTASGAKKGMSPDGLLSKSSPYRVSNASYNFGLKHNFKNRKKKSENKQ